MARRRRSDAGGLLRHLRVGLAAAGRPPTQPGGPQRDCPFRGELPHASALDGLDGTTAWCPVPSARPAAGQSPKPRKAVGLQRIRPGNARTNPRGHAHRTDWAGPEPAAGQHGGRRRRVGRRNRLHLETRLQTTTGSGATRPWRRARLPRWPWPAEPAAAGPRGPAW